MANASRPTAKKKTWAVALAAIVAFLVVLAVSLVILFACNTTEPTPSDEPTGAVGDVSSEFFTADPWYEKSLSTKDGASELEGKLLDVYEKLSLATVLVTDIDNYNFDVDTVKMVDLVTGETLLESYVRNERGVAALHSIDAEFCDECGIFAITVENYDDPTTPDVDESGTDVYHYTSKARPELLGKTDSRGHDCRDLGDVYAIHVDKKISFFDEGMNLLSDMNGDFVDVDDIPYLSADSFMVSEKEGYFYFFNSDEALVFNLEGDCTAKYTDTQTTNGTMNCFVLNNGKLLIQRSRFLEKFSDKCDIRQGSTFIDLETMVMDNVTGEITEIECNFAVSRLSAAYEADPENSGFPLLLKDGYQNQAYVHYFKDTVISEEADYVVLDNALKVVYEFPREGKNVNFADFTVIDESRFVARVTLGGESKYQLFDVNGKFISVAPGTSFSVSESFITSEKVIYNHEMKEIYNFAKDRFEFKGITGDVIYLERYNEATEKDEIYSYTKNSSAPELSANGIDLVTYVEINNDYCAVLDESGLKTLYNLNGEVIAATDGYMRLIATENALVMCNTIDGVVRNYVLRQVQS